MTLNLVNDHLMAVLTQIASPWLKVPWTCCSPIPRALLLALETSLKHVQNDCDITVSVPLWQTLGSVCIQFWYQKFYTCWLDICALHHHTKNNYECTFSRVIYKSWICLSHSLYPSQGKGRVGKESLWLEIHSLYNVSWANQQEL